MVYNKFLNFKFNLILNTYPDFSAWCLFIQHYLICLYIIILLFIYSMFQRHKCETVCAKIWKTCESQIPNKNCDSEVVTLSTVLCLYGIQSTRLKELKNGMTKDVLLDIIKGLQEWQEIEETSRSSKSKPEKVKSD